MAKVEPNIGRRVKFGGLPTLGIRRRVSSPFLPFVMCTRRRRIPSVSKRTHDITTMKDPRLPVFALTLNSMEGYQPKADHTLINAEKDTRHMPDPKNRRKNRREHPK